MRSVSHVAVVCNVYIGTDPQPHNFLSMQDATRELEQLKKAVTEKDEMIGKLKQLALKSKKELQEVKAKVSGH